MGVSAPRDKPSGAIVRLSRDQREELAGVIASFATDGMAASPEFEEIEALSLLGEITAEEKHERLVGLALGHRSPWSSEPADAVQVGPDGRSSSGSTGAVERLDPDMGRELRSMVASFAMDGKVISPAEQEILALYLLGEITAVEMRARLWALAGMQRPPGLPSQH